MADKGMGISVTFLYARFALALPNEYNHVKATLPAMKKSDRYSTQPRKKESQRSSRLPEQAFFSSESGGRRGVRRGHGRGRRGTQGHGRGGNSSKGGGSSSGEGSSIANRASGVATVAVANLLATVGDATGGATSGRDAP